MVWKGLKVDLGLQKNYITISWSLANEFHFHGWSRGSKLWKTWKGLKECQKWDQKSFATQVYIHYYLPQHTGVMRLMNDSISSSLGKISCLFDATVMCELPAKVHILNFLYCREWWGYLSSSTIIWFLSHFLLQIFFNQKNHQNFD